LHIVSCRNRYVLLHDIVSGYGAARTFAGAGTLMQSLSRPNFNDFEPILGHLVEARDAAIQAGLSATIEAIERAIVSAALEFNPRRRRPHLIVINGLKSF
jgi:hypothetical protein